MRVQTLLLMCILFCSSYVNAESVKGNQEIKSDPSRTVIYFQPNTTQLFTELYQAYGFLNPPSRTVFEDALYLDQSIPPSVTPLQPSNQAIFDHTSQVLSDFHKRVNDLELYIDPNKPTPFFYTAAGSKHLIVALVYSIAMSEPNKKFLFVEQAPLYSGHPNAVSGIFHYPNARFFSFHDPSEIQLEPDEVLVEFVTSPNNPDGKFRKPLTNAQIIIADFVFASSAFGIDGTGYLDKNIEWVRQARAQGKHLFSFNSASKQFGKTGARCGYIWFPLYDTYAASIFNKFFTFISSSTVGGGTTGLEEFLNLIEVFLTLPDTGKALRNDANKSLLRRHELVETELLRHYPGSTVLSIPGSPTFFAKIKDSRIPHQQAWEVIFEDLGIVVNKGEPMGESNEFIRINLSGYSEGLVECLNRLVGHKKYKKEDVLFVSTQTCPHTMVVAMEAPNTAYIANPNNCLVDADTSKGPMELLCPPFIGYDASSVITIRKIDSSEHPLVVKAKEFTATVNKAGETLHVQWTQPFYLNGHWQIINKTDSPRDNP